MESKSEETSATPAAWVITERKPVRMDPGAFDPEADGGSVKEYRLSDIGRYLLHPGPIEIRKRLAGCEIFRARSRLRRWLQRLNPRKSRRARPSEVVLSGLKLRLPAMRDPDLDAHLRRIADELRGFDTFGRRLARLEPREVAQLAGICEDIGGGYSYLKLQGSVDDKVRYLTAHVGREVRVTIHRAHVSDGLFELRAFPGPGFDASRAFRLLAYRRDGEPAACVLTPAGHLDFRLADPAAVKYLGLLESTLNACGRFRRTFASCLAGSARPVRLFFNRQIEVDYSKAGWPDVYRSVFRASEAQPDQRNLVKPVLNHLQTSVSLSYLPADDPEADRPLSHVCILHDLRALEPLRKSLPAVYAEVSRRAFSTEAGRFYVLDSIAGGGAHAD
jgi:hypothetical protein